MIDINQIMQVSVTPVFLLAGIGSLLLTMTNRLGRIKDRVRYLRRVSLDYGELTEDKVFEEASGRLILRSKFCYGSIALASTSALFVCVVILGIFIQELYQLEMLLLVAFLFMACIVFLIFSLIFLVIEVFLATRTTHNREKDLDSIIYKLERTRPVRSDEE